MFDRIFADYLLKKGALSEADLHKIYTGQEKRYVRLGVIAISEKLMTIEQVEEVNELQTIYDKRFGDIAISEGYLNEEQVGRLLVLQGNAFLAFMQAVIDLDLMSADEFDDALMSYQKDNNLTPMNMEELKSCNVDRIMPIFLYDRPELVQNLCGVMVRTSMRLLDNHIYVKQPRIVDSVDYSCLSLQELTGDHKIVTAITGDIDDAMKKAAVAFAGADNVEGPEDTLDAMCELINCVNGLLATDMSNKDVDIDMLAPVATDAPGTMKSKSILVLPIVVCGKDLDVLVILDEDYSI